MASELIPTYRGSVQSWHCDHMGHMNVMWYVGKFDEATWNLLSAAGLSGAYFREQGRGMVAVDQHLQYKRELLAGDTVVIGSGVREVKSKVLLFFHEMRNGETGEVAATCRFTAVHLDTAKRKACAFPPAVAERAAALTRAYDFGVAS
ncbi:MAG: thioesterase superfamily protein [Betaproteobacteria bacterium]|nr:thioesterase superfamily protein [Betaproteobacteria bacterium]